MFVTQALEKKYLADKLYEPGAPVQVPVCHVAWDGCVRDEDVLPGGVAVALVPPPGHEAPRVGLGERRTVVVGKVQADDLRVAVVGDISTAGLQDEELGLPLQGRAAIVVETAE